MNASHERFIEPRTTAADAEYVPLDSWRLLVISRYPETDGRFTVLETRGLEDIRLTTNRTYTVDEIEDRLVEAWDRDAGEPFVPCRLALELPGGAVIHQHST